MPTVEVRNNQESPQFWLAGKRLDNGSELMLRLRGLGGWTPVVVTGLPKFLQVRTYAADGKEIVTSLPYEAEVRWAGRYDDRLDDEPG